MLTSFTRSRLPTRSLVLLCLLCSAAAGCEFKPVQFACPPQLAEARCYRLNVPLDHFRRCKSKRIPISYAVVTPPPPAPVWDAALIFVPGGPGAGSMNANPQTLATSTVAAFLQRPVVIFDPRGTGNTSRLDCGALFAVPPVDVVAQAAAVRRCVRQVGRQAVHYSARAMAADIDLIRAALGVPRLDLFGVSYGTLVSQVFAALYPNTVRSLLLDAPVPLRNTDAFNRRHLRAYERIYRLLDPSFSPANVRAVVRALRANPRTVPIPPGLYTTQRYPLNPRTFFELYATTPAALPAAVNAAAKQANYSALDQLVGSTAVRNIVPPLPTALYARALAPIAMCNDLAPILPWKFKAKNQAYRIRRWRRTLTQNRALRTVYQPFRPLEAFPIFTRLCASFPYSQLWREGLPVRARLEKNVAALVLIGDLDSNTPIEDLDALDELLKEKISIVKGAGHTTASHPCGLNLINEFLASLSISNASACA